MLFLITNTRLTGREENLKTVEEAIQGKIDAVIIREKEMEPEDLMEFTRKIVGLARGSHTKIIVNSSFEAAYRFKLPLHLSFDSYMKNRDLELETGVSVHSAHEAKMAQGADYILAGHVFDTDCKKGLPGRGLEFIRNVRKSCDCHIAAIGGIDESNVLEVIEAGADSVAMMSSILKSKDPRAYVERIKKIIAG